MKVSFVRNMAIFIFVIIFASIILFWAIFGYTVYEVSQDPKVTAKEIGEIVKSFNDGMNDTTQTK